MNFSLSLRYLSSLSLSRETLSLRYYIAQSKFVLSLPTCTTLYCKDLLLCSDRKRFNVCFEWNSVWYVRVHTYVSLRERRENKRERRENKRERKEKWFPSQKWSLLGLKRLQNIDQNKQATTIDCFSNFLISKYLYLCTQYSFTFCVFTLRRKVVERKRNKTF